MKLIRIYRLRAEIFFRATDDTRSLPAFGESDHRAQQLIS